MSELLKVICTGFLECPACLAKLFYQDVDGPLELRAQACPETMKDIDGPKESMLGRSHGQTVDGTRYGTARKLQKYHAKWDAADTDPSLV